MGRRRAWVLAWMLITCAAGCKRETPTGVVSAPSATTTTADGGWFREMAGERGVRFVHECAADGRFLLPEIMGSGVALFDFDNDGRLDLLFVQNGGPQSSARNKLFHQEADGSFRDVSAGSGLDVNDFGMGVAVGDVNNDGLPDVLLTNYGGIRMMMNRGGGRFEDVTNAAGLETPGWSVSAAFADLDRDGWLDLVVVRYVAYTESVQWKDGAGQLEYSPPPLFQGSSTRVYRNLGAKGGAAKFEDVSFASGVGRVTGPGLGVVCADFDGDGWPDIFVTNDGAANHLWINHHDFTFTEEAAARGIGLNMSGVAQANMGIAIGDVAGSGMVDAYVTHLTEETNILWQQGPAGFFQDRTAAAGLATSAWRGTGFGTAFIDFDNDGHLDLALVNGRVRRSRIGTPSAGAGRWGAYVERNQLFRGERGGRFRDVSAEQSAFCAMPNLGRGLACGDLDNDGGVDLVVSDVAGPARVYRNVAPRGGHWLIVRAIDPALGGRDAYGAHVVVRNAAISLHGWINPGYSYASSSDARLHIGLGAAERFDSIDVTWPDGMSETFGGGTADRVLVLSRGTGRRSGTNTSPAR